MPFFQYRCCSLFSCPVLSEIFHICMAETDPKPIPVMAVIKFQIRSVFFFCILTVHHITVEYRHGMITTHQLRPDAFLLCPLLKPVPGTSSVLLPVRCFLLVVIWTTASSRHSRASVKSYCPESHDTFPCKR